MTIYRMYSQIFCAGLMVLCIAFVGAAEIHDAAQQGDIETVKNLIQDNPELVNATDDFGNTPLHFAAAGRQNEIAEFLISQDADVNALNTVNQSILLYAAYFDNAVVAEDIIEKGARLNEQDIIGRAPLHYAARQHSLGALLPLIEHGAEIDIRDSIGETPMHFAIRWGYDDIAEMLLEGGAKMGITTEDGKTYLHFACIKGYTAVADLLINEGIEINTKDAGGKTPLYYAAKYGNREIASLLIEKGAEANEIEENYGPSPLLQKELKLGEAYIWYLGHSGIAMKTKEHFLVLDYWNYAGQPDEPSLANGHINVDEIKDQNVYVFVTHNHIDHHDSIIYYWQEPIPNITYIFGWQDTAGTEYIRLGPRESQMVNDIQVQTIQSPDAEETGGNFVIKVDGLTIYHSGGYSHDTSQYALFKEDIKYLGQIAKDADIAFVRIGNDWQNEEALLTIEMVKPKIMFPLHSREREVVYRNFAEQAGERKGKTEIICAENRGDRYFYSKGGMQ
jgi:ankyrin repeat protein/L-ascorbate metabolism protein UlaG (beta-lactamase superfamily)